MLLLAVIVLRRVLRALTRSTGPGQPATGDRRTPDRRRRWAAAARCARGNAPAAAAPPAANARGHPAPPGTSALLEHNGEPVLVLSGEIDVNTLQAFDTRTGCLRQAPSPTPFVTVADVPRGDLRRLHGLRFLVRCTHAACASGPQPILRGPTPLVQRVLGLPG